MKKGAIEDKDVVYSTKERSDFICPLFGISLLGIGKENCIDQTSIPAKNRTHCCDVKCPSPWRRCPICLSQGVNNVCSVDVKTGYCEFHNKHGPDAKHDGDGDKRVSTANGKERKKSEGKIKKISLKEIDGINRMVDGYSTKFHGGGEESHHIESNEKGESVTKKEFKKLSHFDRIGLIKKMVVKEDGDRVVVANKLGASKALIGFYEAASRLTPEVQEMLKPDAPQQIAFYSAIPLWSLPPNLQIETAKEIIKNKLSPKDASRLVKAIKKTAGLKKAVIPETELSTKKRRYNLKKKSKKRGKYKKRKKKYKKREKSAEPQERESEAFSEAMSLFLNHPAELIKKIVIETEKGIKIIVERI